MVESGRKFMFFGYFEHSLDDKGRVVVPSKLRSQCGNTLYILQGYDGALSIYKEDEYLKMIEKVNSLPFNIRKNRDFIRTQLATTCELEIDKQGRIQLPTQLLNKYSIGKDIVFIGVGNHIELWDKKFYLEYEAKALEDFEKNAEEIVKED